MNKNVAFGTPTCRRQGGAVWGILCREHGLPRSVALECALPEGFAPSREHGRADTGLRDTHPGAGREVTEHTRVRVGRLTDAV